MGYAYLYDCENHLLEVNDFDDNNVAAYDYDYRGRRISKTADGKTTNYVYDGAQVIATDPANVDKTVDQIVEEAMEEGALRTICKGND